MAQAALSYQQPQRQPRELEQPRPPLRVLPGSAPSQAQQAGLASLLRTLFVSCIAAVLLFGVVSLVRVGLADATMAVLADSEQVSQAIEAQRSEGARLEMQYSIASSPAAIQEAASQLGMAPDPQVEYLRVVIGE
ncbi:MAG: hypothetical protein FWF91_04060 [Coriobacteriia bacterium]|nr:hypothetical protein [Coriobacteriia bacterium]